MSIRIALFAASLLMIAVGCSEPNPIPDPSDSNGQPAQMPTANGAANGVHSDRTATPDEQWVETRVSEARNRLQTSEAGQLVWRSIKAHGGLDRWYENGPIFFRFNYRPLGGQTVRDTYQVVDTWSARARHELADERAIQFGWDGEKAWVRPADAELDITPRFWALTPYYFIGMPFVLADPGVNLEMVGEKMLDGQPYRVVKVTFGEDTGDAPDDYYVLYFEPETHQVRALRYVVSYPGFFPDGGHSPEKLMYFEGEQTVRYITLAERYPTHKWDPETEQPGEKVTDIQLDEVEYRPDTSADFFEIPGGARILEGY